MVAFYAVVVVVVVVVLEFNWLMQTIVELCVKSSYSGSLKYKIWRRLTFTF